VLTTNKHTHTHTQARVHHRIVPIHSSTHRCIAEVTAIYKKGQRADRSNYRPVSLTSVCCKILESLIRDHVMTYLLQNNLLSNKQYGFIKRKSTSLQLLQLMDKWTEYLEIGSQIDVIYTDFEKAFDKVPHARLVSKLKSYGITKTLIDWISPNSTWLDST